MNLKKSLISDRINVIQVLMKTQDLEGKVAY